MLYRYTCTSICIDILVYVNLYNFIRHLPKYIYESSFSGHLIMTLKMQSQETHPVMCLSFPMKNLRRISS